MDYKLGVESDHADKRHMVEEDTHRQYEILAGWYDTGGCCSGSSVSEADYDGYPGEERQQPRDADEGDHAGL